MKTLLFAAFLACLAPFGRVHASGSPADVSVEFTLVGWAGEIQNLAYKQDGKLTVLKIPAYARSPVYRYTGPARMAFYQAPGADRPAGDDPEVGAVTFESGVNRFTVLIAAQGEGYQVRAAADDETHFPLGRARFFNLCPVRVLMRCNQKNAFVLQPDQMELVSPRADQVILVTETAFDRNGTWVRANDDFVGVPADAQTSVFFIASADDHFKSIDGVSRNLQMVILRETPGQRKKSALSAEASVR